MGCGAVLSRQPRDFAPSACGNDAPESCGESDRIIAGLNGERQLSEDELSVIEDLYRRPESHSKAAISSLSTYMRGAVARAKLGRERKAEREALALSKRVERSEKRVASPPDDEAVAEEMADAIADVIAALPTCECDRFLRRDWMGVSVRSLARAEFGVSNRQAMNATSAALHATRKTVACALAARWGEEGLRLLPLVDLGRLGVRLTRLLSRAESATLRVDPAASKKKFSAESQI
jgi:DNA-directed RNA polymerase specialized sigma24 family protein